MYYLHAEREIINGVLSACIFDMRGYIIFKYDKHGNHFIDDGFELIKDDLLRLCLDIDSTNTSYSKPFDVEPILVENQREIKLNSILEV